MMLTKNQKSVKIPEMHSLSRFKSVISREKPKEAMNKAVAF
jgi:hypothetical protein